MIGKLTAQAIVERALEIGDAEGLDAVTIRRLAADLGVTPMALYWHFKNKERLLAGMAGHLVLGFAATAADDDRPWQERLRELVEGLIGQLRSHPCAKHVLEQVDPLEVPAFLRVWDQALGLSKVAGFTDEECCLISKYLLQSAIAIADAPVHFQSAHTEDEVCEIVRVKQLGLQSLPVDAYPNLVAMAGPMVGCIDPAFADAFGVDLIINGIDSLAARR